MAWRKALRGGSAVALAAALAVWFPGVASADSSLAFTIKDARITESSGMVRDTAAGVYWTVNDSGSTGVVYGVGSNGKVRGTLNYRADPVDVEAVAMYKQRLYVADIGDNEAKRDTVRIYYFDNPRASGLTVAYKALDFRYPDGAHDAETLLVTPKGRLYIITKEAKGGVYRAPEEPSRDGVNELTKVNTSLGLVTDGVILPGGKQIALLTYTKVAVVDAASGKEVASESLPKLSQPESLAVSLDGTSLMVGSEGKNSKVYEMSIPQAASASPSPSATADAGSDDEPDDTSTATNTGLRSRGTMLAVGLAGVVAVVAGVVVGVVRRA